MDCIFCKLATGVIPTDMVYQDNEIAAFKDANPKSPVHILVIPKKHIASVNELSGEDVPLMGKMIEVATQIAKQQGIANTGYRLVVNCGRDGGVEVDHLHLHLMGGRQLQSMG